MSNDKLRSTLDNLHRELGDVQQLDEATVDTLKQIVADIDRVLATDQISADEIRDVRGQLDNAVLKFESEHPRLTQVLSELTYLLANLGI